MVASFSTEQIASASPSDISDELERGNIIVFPECPISLPDEDDQNFLREEMPRAIQMKNVSYHPEIGRVAGFKGPEADRASHILRDHATNVQQFLEQAIPSLTRDWTVGTSSFRPREEKGRNLGAHASNELVHVDAGAYGATHGDRVLRFFVNLNPERDRVWITKGAFPELYSRYGSKAGIATNSFRSLNKSGLDKAYSGILRASEKMGFSYGRLIDSSPYDRLMRRFHNYMKDTPEFQSSMEGHEEFRFPPFSAWMVFTDMVSHACIEGQFALVDTFVVPLKNCRLQELAPMNILKSPTRPIPV